MPPSAMNTLPVEKLLWPEARTARPGRSPRPAVPAERNVRIEQLGGVRGPMAAGQAGFDVLLEFVVDRARRDDVDPDAARRRLLGHSAHQPITACFEAA